MNKSILIILDGWGKGKGDKADAISKGETPNLHKFFNKYPNSELITSGEDVGLPKGQMGNSEVGHLNIGAGRIVYQDLVKINKAIEDNSITKNPKITEAFTFAKENNSQVHFIGLLSDGGVHSLNSHLYKLCEISDSYGIKKSFIHAFTDGRDTDPKSGIKYIKELNNFLTKSNVKLATVSGRYYGMDRDKRWERIKLAYDMLISGKGNYTNNITSAIEENYKNGTTDEFLKPIILSNDLITPKTTIKENDVIICFNFRTDRLRQLTTVLTQTDFPDFEMKTLSLKYYTMTNYDSNFKNINVIYNKENLKNTIGEHISNLGYKQIRIAETEKYAHVTFFFSGGREKLFKGEERFLIPSPKVTTYDLQPEMSAFLVRDKLVELINNNAADFIVVNFANGDMVGHTGVYEAILKAVKVIDTCVGDVVNAAIKNNFTALIIADHGNSDHAINDDGTPNTAHSLNPVPCILISEKYKSIKNGRLANVAPTLLKIMDLSKPAEMTQESLI